MMNISFEIRKHKHKIESWHFYMTSWDLLAHQEVNVSVSHELLLKNWFASGEANVTHTPVTVKNWRVFFFVQSLVGAVEWMLWSSAVTRLFVLQRRWQTEEGSPRQQQLEHTCVHMCTHTHTLCLHRKYLLSIYYYIYYQLEPIKFLHWTTFFGRSLIPHHWLLSLSPVSEIFRLCPLWGHKGHARL